MKKTIICAWSLDFLIGGSEGYLMRIGEWARENDFSSILLLQKGRTISEMWDDKLKVSFNRVEFFECKHFFDAMTFSEELRENLNRENSIIICADIYVYLRLVSYKKLNKLDGMTVWFYVLHPSVTRISNNRVINLIYKRFFRKEIENSFLFMDEECIYECKKYYGENVKIDDIYRIGYKVPDYDLDISRSRLKNKEHINILSASRMVFPFKGYQCGVVEAAETIIKRCPNVHFTIIGSGPDSYVIDRKINEMSKDARLNIKRMENVTHERLIELMKEAYVYIGMGTTLLDAASVGLPSIVAMHDQMGMISSGLFIDSYNNVGGIPEISNCQTDFLCLLKKILSMDNNSYLELCKDSYNVLSHHYDINYVMNKIMNRDCEKINIPLYLMVFDWLFQKYKKRI